MKELSASLQALVEFMRIDIELIAVAAERSAPRSTSELSSALLEKWIQSLTPGGKEKLLLKIARGDEPNPRRSLLRSFRDSSHGLPAAAEQSDATPRRTVGEIAEAWQGRVREAESRAVEKARKERERQARAETKARERYLRGVASRAASISKEVSASIAKRTPQGYDRAVELLSDLKDAAAMTNQTGEFEYRLSDLREQHAGKPSLARRLDDAGLDG